MPLTHSTPTELIDLIHLMEYEIDIEDLHDLDDEGLERLSINLDYWRSVATAITARRADAKAAQQTLWTDAQDGPSRAAEPDQRSQ